MDNFKTVLTQIKSIRPHPDLETTSLEIATVFDWDVVIKKGQFQVEDKVIYVCPDSVLNPELEAKVFGPNSKVKLNKGRVRQIRLRKYPSQGLLLPANLLPGNVNDYTLNQDVKDILGVTKYEPPQASYGIRQPQLRNKPLENSRFPKYQGLKNLKWCPGVFDGKEVVIQSKIHGTHARFGLQPTQPNTLWKKVLKVFRLLPDYEYCVGINNAELTNRPNYKGFYGEDVYSKAFKACNAELKVEKGETIYGEVVFEGCQKGYHYGHKEPHFILFDVKVTEEDGTQKYLNPEQVLAYAKERNFDVVPFLYIGQFDKDKVQSLLTGPDPYYPKHEIKEGLVIKLRTDYNGGPNGKQAYKILNPEYLDLKDTTDFH